MYDTIAFVKEQPAAEFLFRPDGEVWNVDREAILILGGQRALLMQIAHPLVGEAVAEYSGFPKNAVTRLRHTITLLDGLKFGTREESLKAAQAINNAHKSVQGTLSEDVGVHKNSSQYDARNPKLSQWVWATLVDSALVVREKFVGPLSDKEKEAYYQESKGILPLLGGKPQDTPSSFIDFTDYMHEMIHSGEVAVGTKAHALAPHILFTEIPVISGILFPFSRISIGLLPKALQEQYGLTWSENDQRFLDRVSATTRRIIPHLPDIIRFSSKYRRGRRLANPI